MRDNFYLLYTFNVVASLDEATDTIYIITAHVPNTIHFNEDLKTRRKDEKKRKKMPNL